MTKTTCYNEEISSSELLRMHSPVVFMCSRSACGEDRAAVIAHNSVTLHWCDCGSGTHPLQWERGSSNTWRGWQSLHTLGRKGTHSPVVFHVIPCSRRDT